MGIKLIAADLDGTLMYTDHMTVTPRTYNALKAAHDRGVHLAIATGRPRSLVGYVIEQLPFADYIISANGASVYSVKEKKNVYSDLIDNGTAVRVINRFLQEPVFFQAYCDGHAHYQADREPFFDYDDFPSDFIAQAQLHMTEYPDLCAGLGGRDIEMLAFYSLKRDMLPVYQELLTGYGLTVTNSFEGNIDVTSPTADKGSALRGLCAKLGISPDDAAAFGDSGNDISMLRAAGYSFAMENAVQECKAAAKYVTLSNAQDGLAKAVEDFCLND
jgi:hypothetical protein